MKTLIIRRQVRLRFARVAEICLHGIYHRLFRSLVTLSIVAVAVAFMMYMLAGSLIGRGVLRHAQGEAAACKLYDHWVAWFEDPMDKAALVRLTASCSAADPRLRSLRRWAGVDAAGLREMQDLAQDSQRFMAAVDALPPGKRLLLTGALGDGFLLDVLQNPAACDRFLALAAASGGVRLPDGPEGLRRLLARGRAQQGWWDKACAGRAAALQELRRHLPEGTRVSSLFTAPTPELAGLLGTLGLLDDPALLQPLQVEARYKAEIARLMGLMKKQVLLRDVAARAGVDNLGVRFEDLAQVYLGRGGPEFVDASLRRSHADCTLDHAATRRLFAEHLRRLRVLRIETEAAEGYAGFLGFNQTTWWLIGVSVVVCMVGIANAMLMSVMERFREIATMKCLGAKDAFVMRLFVMESCMQGVAGGILGALLGLLLALPLNWIKFGALLWTAMPWGALWVSALSAIAIGVLLSGVASLYPARVAAHLSPMEAMRVE